MNSGTWKRNLKNEKKRKLKVKKKKDCQNG